jgi:hypothetical protein
MYNQGTNPLRLFMTCFMLKFISGFILNPNSRYSMREHSRGARRLEEPLAAGIIWSLACGLTKGKSSAKGSDTWFSSLAFLAFAVSFRQYKTAQSPLPRH